ncbi:DUF6975 family protein [Hephaestia sp. GCM10023244]|uniref:DUF6975 family protein n=1 Tax=unclassified Hephaestia TaxID=2631281 RepID=UPI002077882D|nr:hypothetical protein [Hephaestia sp. MAHUQ-44]MCM8729991.1 hypothetical protein [Hephaestia sp. MAHUQ-44]
MTVETAQFARPSAPWQAVPALVMADGTAAHPAYRALLAPAAPLRDVIDAVHAICMLHGRHPGVVDFALARDTDKSAEAWLVEAARAFETERACLVRLVAAAGPLPSTPGQAESEAAIVAQAHALDTLAQSDRTGCAIGAAVALVLDWAPIRDLLNRAARRFGIDITADTLPAAVDTTTLLATAFTSPAVERAILFGTEQVLAQHRGLWSLLESRAVARNRS